MEDSIEKDYSYFKSLGIQENANAQELKLLQKVMKIAKKKKSRKEKKALLLKANQSLKTLSKISAKKSNLSISKKSVSDIVKKPKQPTKHTEMTNSSQTFNDLGERVAHQPIENDTIKEESDVQIKYIKS